MFERLLLKVLSKRKGNVTFAYESLTEVERLQFLYRFLDEGFRVNPEGPMVIRNVKSGKPIFSILDLRKHENN